MNWKVKKAVILSVTAIVLCILLSACRKRDEKRITQAVEAYLTSVKEHDIEKTAELIHGEQRIFDPNDKELLQEVYYTIEDCYLESIDFPDTDNLEIVTVTVNYIIVYSDEYIPIGSRSWGKNEIKERFTLEKLNNQYIITGVEPIFDW